MMYMMTLDYNIYEEAPVIVLINLIFTLMVDGIFLIVKLLRMNFGKKNRV